MKIRKMKSNLDERQELKLLKIEHNGCWIAFWGLLIVMAIQMIVGNDSIIFWLHVSEMESGTGD